MATIDTERWQRLSPYLDRALELEGEALAAWLTALHAEHPEIAGEVEARLASLRALDEEGFLEKDPRQWHASLRELADNLKRYLNDEPVLACTDNTWYRARKFVSRHRWPVALGTTPPAPAVLYKRAEELEYLGRFPESRDAYLKCVALAEQLDAPAKLDCTIGLASLSIESGDLAGAEGYLAAASALMGPSYPARFPQALRIQNLRGSIQMRQGQFAEARTNLDAVIADARSMTLVFMGLRNRAEVNLLDGKLAAAEADAQRALQMARTAQGDLPYSSRTGLASLILGRVLQAKGDAVRAQQAFADAVAHLSNTVDAHHPALIRAQELAHGG